MSFDVQNIFVPRIIDEIQERRLQQLNNDQRALDFDERNSGKRHRSLLQRVQCHLLGRQLAEVLEELWERVLNTLIREKAATMQQ